MFGLIGEKLGMSQILNENGTAEAVTYVFIEPNIITKLKTAEKNGYNAIVLGYRKLKKPKKTKQFTYTKEMPVNNIADYKIDDILTVEKLQGVEQVKITGISKGKGMQGVIKRFNFHGGPETHGSCHHREPGAVGARAKPGRIKKGKKLPGRMGNDTITLSKRKILSIDAEKNIIAIKGALPGGNGAFITIKTA